MSAVRAKGTTVPSLLLSSLLAAGLAPGLGAQQDTLPLARAWLAALVPASDDPDARAQELLTIALAHARSPLAAQLAQEVMNQSGSLLRPAALRDWLRSRLDGERRHGRLQDRLVELVWRLDRLARGQAAAGLQPPAGYAQHHLLAGPYGDGGDHYVGVVFAPELQFPALPAAPVLPSAEPTTARLANATYSDYLVLRHPRRPEPGCHYSLTCWRADRSVDTFLEVGLPGDFQVFVDGKECLRVERWRQNAQPLAHLPLHLPAGVHTVLLKACSSDGDAAVLRFVDADATVTAAVQQVAAEAATEATGERATVREDRFVDALAVLATAAGKADADPAVRLAAVLLASQERMEDQALAWLEPLRRQPPADPSLRLASAHVLRSAPLPDELRKAEARAAIEAAAPALGEDHHGARLLQAQLLDQQDQREQALRLLAAHPAPGPATFQYQLGLLRQLRFQDEIEPLLRRWTAVLPDDARPHQELGNLLLQRSDAVAAEAEFRLAARHKHTPDLARDLWQLALARADFAAAEPWLEVMEPGTEPRTLDHLELQHQLALARGDARAAATIRRAVLAHPHAMVGHLEHVAGLAQSAGDLGTAIEALQLAQALGPDSAARRSWLGQLGSPSPDADFVPFRRDGKALASAFQPGEGERGASTTVLFDQRIHVVHGDGSVHTEVHTLRRVNDQQGVEAFAQGTGLGRVDELLLLRTIGTDGRDYVPSRIDDDYAMQRLEPGAFVEWRFRVHGGAPGQDAIDTEPFLLGDGDEPCRHAELVLVQPAGGRGELRTRHLGEPAERRTLDDGRQVTIFVQKDVPKRTTENLEPPAIESEAVAEFGEDAQPFANWRALRAYVLARSRPESLLAGKAAELLAGLADDRARTAAIWQWCQQEIEDGPNDRAIDALLRKKGNRTMLAAALLRAHGLEVVPFACDEERAELRGGDDSLFPPPAAAGGHGIAVRIADSAPILLFLDAPRHWPLGAIPAARSGVAGVLLYDDRTEPFVLPAASTAVQSLQVRGRVRIGRQGTRLEARATLGDVQGTALAQRVRELQGNTRKMAARQVAQQMFGGFRVESAAFAEDGPLGALTLDAVLTRSGAQQDGDEFVATLPIPADKLVASFGDRGERTKPFRFPGDLANDWELEVTFDDGLQPRDLPASTSLAHGPLHYLQELRWNGSRLTLRRRMAMRPATVPAAQFGEWMRVLLQVDRSQQATMRLWAETGR